MTASMEDESIDEMHLRYEEDSPDIDFDEVWSYLHDEYGFTRFRDIWDEAALTGRELDLDAALHAESLYDILSGIDNVFTLSKKENRKRYYTRTL